MDAEVSISVQNPEILISKTDNEICPETHANEMHELYDRHHKLSPTLNSY